MKIFSSKPRIVAAAVLILLVLFLLRPGASRLKSRVVRSISAAVGRPVEVGSVHLRLLPRPGFDLESLVVYDDPAFGAEPMLRASEVTADLRLISLLRGRLEIARLDLTEPSLNLVHGVNGRWNMESLLERTAHMPLAPTSKAKSEKRPGFPYIEASSARINFKSGPEKKPYALTNADFSLWQDSENTWGVRLKAQPFRTDLNLNDTGLLQVNGTWQRADSLQNTPVQLSLEWSRAQLGQLTKFFTGNDQGWRGGVQVDVTLAGTPANLQVVSTVSVQDFRRYDIARGDALTLAVHCGGQYSSSDHAFSAVACDAPVGRGLITLKGDLGLPTSHHYHLAIEAQNVPAIALVALAQRAKKNLPDDLIAAGGINGKLSISESSSSSSGARWEGRGEIADFTLESASNKAKIGPETVPFLFASGDEPSAAKAAQRLIRNGRIEIPPGPRFEFGPFPLAHSRGSAFLARGVVGRAGYKLSVVGDVDIDRFLSVARMAGIPALNATAEGTAQIDLQVAGTWAGQAGSGVSGPLATGTAKLRNVSVALRGSGGALEISSAEMQLSSDEVRVGKLNAKAANSAWTGSIEMPRGCGTPGACQIRFNLNANQIALNELREWVSPHPKERSWYEVLGANGQATPSFLASVRASGRMTADRVNVQSLETSRVAANVSLDNGKLQISDLTAEVLGGKHRGEWQADFGESPAVCSGGGALTGISMARLSDAMKDAWITGAAHAKYEVKGACAEFWESAEGTLEFEMRDATLSHISLGPGGGALQASQFSGQARLRAGKIEIKEANLESAEGKFLVSGTASLQRELDLKFARLPNSTATGYTISGTLAAPKVVSSSKAETQARLKTEAAK